MAKKPQQFGLKPSPKNNTGKISPDVDSDKTGTDTAADHTTIKKGQQEHSGRFDKPDKEVNPDTTGIDKQNSPPADTSNSQNNSET
ncbi:MAG: hypothetical protein IT221_12375 [Fluviicola sp.]|nr:hypothetical protein [Fluviicola sp.]